MPTLQSVTQSASMAATRAAAFERAARQPGEFVGVVLAKPAPVDTTSPPTWDVFRFESRAELVDWFGDWSSGPGLYHYMAAFDRTMSADPSAPILEADDQRGRYQPYVPAGPSVEHIVSSTVGEKPFARVARLVASHEVFWSHMVELHPQSDLARWWLVDKWDPFYTDWTDLVSHHGLADADVDVLTEQLQRLNALRMEAVHHEIPLPDNSPVVISGWLGDMWDDLTTELGEAGDAVVDVVQRAAHSVTSSGHGRGGRGGRVGLGRGRRFEGRGAWVEPFYAEEPEVYYADPAPLIDLDPGLDPGLDDEDASEVSSGDRENIVADINAETDARFWLETGYKPGRKLDRHDPDDAAMIPRWVEIRYRVTHEYADRAAPHSQHEAHMTYPHEWSVSGESVSGDAVIVGRGGGGGGGGGRGFRNVDAPPDDETLLALAPVVAAGKRGVATQFHFNPQTQHLDATIGIDGRIYRGRADLSKTVHEISGSIAGYHTALHGDPMAPASIAAVQGEINAAIGCAGDALVGAAMAQHQTEMCAGWWHDLTHKISSAVHSVAHGVSSAAKGIGHGVVATLSVLKGPIEKAAVLGATAAATAVLGPEAGPIAGGLAQSLVSSVDSSQGGGAQQAAQAVVQAATQAAQTDPQVAAALNIAHQAVATSTVAHHAAQTAADAAAGNPAAQAQIAQLTQAAAGGDQAAQELQSMMGQIGDQVSDNAAQPTVSGDAEHALAEVAARSAAAEHARGSRFVGIALGAPGHPLAIDAKHFGLLDDADDWFGEIAGDPEAFGYVAYYDAADPMWPRPMNEAYGHAHGSKSVHVSGLLPWLLIGGAGVAAGAFFWPAAHAKLATMFPKVFSAGDITIGADGCGSRKFGGVTPEALDRIFKRLHDKGAEVTGSNPWSVVTHNHGVELRGQWDDHAQALTLEVTDSDFIAPCGAIWDSLEGMLAEVGAHELSA